MRFLPVPTGGKLSKWSAFSEKISSHFPPVKRVRFGLRFWEKSFLISHCPRTFKVIRIFRCFFSPLPTGGFYRFWTKDFEYFLLLYPLEARESFWRSSDHFSLSTHWRVSPVLNERFWKFLRSVPTWQKPVKWSAFSETFFSHYPLEGNGLFGQKVLKHFSPQYPLDSSGRFERKKIKKPPRKSRRSKVQNIFIDFFT